MTRPRATRSILQRRLLLGLLAAVVNPTPAHAAPRAVEARRAADGRLSFDGPRRHVDNRLPTLKADVPPPADIVQRQLAAASTAAADDAPGVPDAWALASRLETHAHLQSRNQNADRRSARLSQGISPERKRTAGFLQGVEQAERRLPPSPRPPGRMPRPSPSATAPAPRSNPSRPGAAATASASPSAHLPDPHSIPRRST